MTTHDTPEAAIETAVRANAHLICDCRQPPECPRVAAVLAAILAALPPGWCGHGWISEEEHNRQSSAGTHLFDPMCGYCASEKIADDQAEIARLTEALARHHDDRLGLACTVCEPPRARSMTIRRSTKEE